MRSIAAASRLGQKPAIEESKNSVSRKTMPGQPLRFQPLKSLTEMAGATPSVGELFRARARIQKSLPAIEYQDRLISYGELLDRVDRLTSVLAARGLVRGDRVALLSRNRPEYLEVELAAANLGVITACLNLS